MVMAAVKQSAKNCDIMVTEQQDYLKKWGCKRCSKLIFRYNIAGQISGVIEHKCHYCNTWNYWPTDVKE